MERPSCNISEDSRSLIITFEYPALSNMMITLVLSKAAEAVMHKSKYFAESDKKKLR